MEIEKRDQDSSRGRKSHRLEKKDQPTVIPSRNQRENIQRKMKASESKVHR